ncbi:lytic transglycosylase domain-containing protein [bacterium]|nr:lytic transglycosylase domain-containing protein [bacterium]
MKLMKKRRFAHSVLILFGILFFGFFPLFSRQKVIMYRCWNDLTNEVIYTNTLSKDCKPKYVERGPISHTKGYRLTSKNEMAYDDIIRDASTKFGVDFYLIKSLIKAESLFDKKAKSRAGAQGLMQLMPATAKQLGVTNSYNPEQNIGGGTRYLAKMIKRFKNVKHAIAAYNAGPAAVVFYSGVPPYNETQNYVQKVANYYQKYSGKSLW